MQGAELAEGYQAALRALVPRLAAGACAKQGAGLYDALRIAALSSGRGGPAYASAGDEALLEVYSLGCLQLLW